MQAVIFDVDGTLVDSERDGHRVAFNLDRLFGAGRFSPVVTGDDVAVRKPDPSAYVQVLDALHLAPHDALAIEDSANGLFAARAADLACVVVANDYTADQDFTGAALVVDSFETLDPPTLALALSSPP